MVIRLLVVTRCACVACSSSVDLFLLRHGIAEPRREGLDHPSRALTSQGKTRTQAMLAWLAASGLEVDRLISSPYTRALQTAWLVHQARLSPAPELSLHLAPRGDLQRLLPQLQGRCLLVGHEPELSAWASLLIGASPGGLRLRKAGCCHLRLSRTGAGGSVEAQLEWLLRPGLLRRSAD